MFSFFITLATFQLLCVLIAMGAKNNCKFGGKDITWRCAHIEWMDPAMVPSVISLGYEWTCCLPNPTASIPRPECNDVSFSEFRSEYREATISLDEWTVNKGTTLNNDWGNCDSKKLCRWNEKSEARIYPACNIHFHGSESTSSALLEKGGSVRLTEETSSSAVGRILRKKEKKTGRSRAKATGGVEKGKRPPRKKRSGEKSGGAKRTKPPPPPRGEASGGPGSAKKEYDDIYDEMYDDMYDDDDMYDNDYYDQDLAAQQNVLMDQYEYDVAVEAAKERRAIERLRNKKRKIDRLKKKMHSS